MWSGGKFTFFQEHVDKITMLSGYIEVKVHCVVNVLETRNNQLLHITLMM